MEVRTEQLTKDFASTLQKSWSLQMPASLVKGEGENASVYIEGLASVEGDDFSGEEVLQKGLDWSYWKEHGFLKWRHETQTHRSQPDDFVAVPDLVESIELEDGRKATKVRGKFRDTGKAPEVISLAADLQKMGRTLGLSVEGGVSARADENGVVAYRCDDGYWRTGEGQVVEHPGRKIVKAIVIDVAIDPHPMHPDARMMVNVAKSLESAFEEPAAPHAVPAPEAARPNKEWTMDPKNSRTELDNFLKGLDADGVTALKEKLGIKTDAPEDKLQKGLDVLEARLKSHKPEALPTDVDATGFLKGLDGQLGGLHGDFAVLAELSKGISSALTEIREKMKGMDLTGVNERLGNIEKAMQTPGPGRAVVTGGAPAPHPAGEQPGEPGAGQPQVNRGQVISSLMKAWETCTDINRKNQLANEVGRVQAGGMPDFDGYKQQGIVIG